MTNNVNCSLFISGITKFSHCWLKHQFGNVIILIFELTNQATTWLLSLIIVDQWHASIWRWEGRTNSTDTASVFSPSVAPTKISAWFSCFILNSFLSLPIHLFSLIIENWTRRERKGNYRSRCVVTMINLDGLIAESSSKNSNSVFPLFTNAHAQCMTTASTIFYVIFEFCNGALILTLIPQWL